MRSGRRPGLGAAFLPPAPATPAFPESRRQRRSLLLPGTGPPARRPARCPCGRSFQRFRGRVGVGGLSVGPAQSPPEETTDSAVSFHFITTHEPGD